MADDPTPAEVDPGPVPDPPKPPRGISDAELEEFEDFYRAHEKNTDVYHVPEAIQAGVGLLLIEVVRALRAIAPNRKEAGTEKKS